MGSLVRERLVPIQERMHPYTPWLALCVVWALFDLPTLIYGTEIDFRQVRPSGEVLALFTLHHVGCAVGYPRVARALSWLFGGLLVACRIDYALFGLILTERPLFYDQLYIMRHTLVLVRDLWSANTLLLLLVIVTTVSVGVWVSVRLLRHAAQLFEPQRIAKTARTLYLVWVIALLASGSHALALTKKPFVRWASPVYAQNLVASRKTYLGVEKGLTSSPYESYDRVPFGRKPDVLLFIVESYGRVLSDDRAFQRDYRALLEQLETRLDQAGYTTASAYTTAPVRGGRSWLADGSMFLGAPTPYEALFNQAIDSITTRNTPTVISFFEKRGYETVMLAPSDRERPGARVVNRYRHQLVLTNKELAYEGEPMGWGLVPDQYSLGFVEERVLKTKKRPVLLTFHMVTSHAPFRPVPPIVDDWRELQRNGRKARPDTKPAYKRVLETVLNFQHSPYVNFRKLKPNIRRGYFDTVRYDLEVLTRFLERDQGDRLIVIVGDHQPPIVNSLTGGYDTPIHVLSRDPRLVEEVVERGFVPGLDVPARARPVLAHAGFFSLLVRTLARGTHDSQVPLPRFMSRGYELVPSSP